MKAKWLLAVLFAISVAILPIPTIAPSMPPSQQQDFVDVILPASELPPGAIVLDKYNAIGYVRALVPKTNPKAISLLTINESSKGSITINDNWELNEPKFHTLLNDSIPLINADDIKALGLNGTNVTVCILDTGFDYFHFNLPAPIMAKDFTTKDWFIDAYFAGTGSQFNYSLNISSATNVTDWIEIGASWFNSSNRFDIEVYYPNNTLANSTAGQNITYKNDSEIPYTCNPNHACYFNILNITIDNTFGIYTIVWNETNISSLIENPILLWGGNVTYLLDHYNAIYNEVYTPMFFNESRVFANIHSQDDHGHGTHVAGTIASNDTTYGGVAPGASLLIGKVLYPDGRGYVADVNSGIQWCIDNGADIISMSLGGSATTNCNSSTDQLIDTAAKLGILPVIAAGNSGPDNETISSPGCARGALTVGATNKSDVIASFSSRGPTSYGTTKPEVVAPGVSITSTIITNAFDTLSGTSMATPHVSGLAAVLKGLNNSWNAASIKAIIINSANQTQISNIFDNSYGFGRIDFLEAVNNTNVTNNLIEENTNLTYVFNVTNKTSFAATIVWLENSTDSHSKIYLYLRAPNGTIVSNSTKKNDTVQKVFAVNPDNGNWTVIVQAVDTNSAENFSLAYSSADLLSITLIKADGLSCKSASECAGGYCVHNICRSSATYCGDGYCDTGETSSNCSDDCKLGGGGGGIVKYETFLLTANIGESQNFILNKGDRIEFNLGNESHTIKLIGILDSKREFTITSEPILIILTEGETKKLDLNGNGINDFAITLLEAIPDGARITVMLLPEEILKKEASPKELTNITTPISKETPTEISKAQEGGKLYSIGFILITIFIVAFWAVREILIRKNLK